MKVLGIVAEYNPLHNGHLYHIQKSRELTGATHTVCIMSGNFVQRGEPAVTNKWARTKMALLAGVDLVIELPAVYAASSAEFFAACSISLLNKMGIIDCISFGSEEGTLEEITSIAKLLADEPEDFKKLLRQWLGRGLSFPAAREKAIKEFSGNINTELLAGSNNILSIEYIKALIRQKSCIVPYTVKRMGAGYNSLTISGGFSSATSIRNYIISGGRPDHASIRFNIPDFSAEILSEEIKSGRCPVSFNCFDKIILSALRTKSPEEIKAIPYVSEGLENRLKQAAGISYDLDGLIESIKVKRYPATRIQRILTALVLNLSAIDFDTFNKNGFAQYIRILGFSKKGRELLGTIKQKAALPVMTKTSAYRKSCNPLYKRMFEFEATATDNYVLCYSNPVFRLAGQDFTQPIIRV